MLLKSRYPELPPAVQGNAYHFLWNRPDQAEWPQDFILHIDAKTDKKRTYREFRERVDLGATALGTPISDGGLGIHGEDGEVVGIISWDSSVGALCRCQLSASASSHSIEYVIPP